MRVTKCLTTAAASVFLFISATAGQASAEQFDPSPANIFADPVGDTKCRSIYADPVGDSGDGGDATDCNWIRVPEISVALGGDDIGGDIIDGG